MIKILLSIRSQLFVNFVLELVKQRERAPRAEGKQASKRRKSISNESKEKVGSTALARGFSK